MFERIKKYITELGHLTPMALVATFLPIVGSATLLVFLVPIGYWLRENWEIGTVVFLAGTIFFCGLALLPTNVIGIVSGWAFGLEIGILVLITGIVGSAIISYLINSRISGERLQEVFKKHPRTQAIYKTLLKERFIRTTLIIFLLRVSVVMPFAFTNFLMASAKVSLKSYIIGTGLGMLPRSSAMVLVGAGLSELDVRNTGQTYLIILGIVATVVSVIVIAYLSRKALERLTQDEMAAEAS